MVGNKVGTKEAKICLNYSLEGKQEKVDCYVILLCYLRKGKLEYSSFVTATMALLLFCLFVALGHMIFLQRSYLKKKSPWRSKLTL